LKSRGGRNWRRNYVSTKLVKKNGRIYAPTGLKLLTDDALTYDIFLIIPKYNF